MDASTHSPPFISNFLLKLKIKNNEVFIIKKNIYIGLKKKHKKQSIDLFSQATVYKEKKIIFIYLLTENFKLVFIFVKKLPFSDGKNTSPKKFNNSILSEFVVD